MSDTVTANGIRVRCLVEGPADAPVVVLSNSLASNLTMWDDQVDALRHRYRVLRYDTRGHGGTAVTPGPYSIDLLAADALALMDAHGVARAHFVGLSMGGMIAQVLAARHADRLTTVSLCDTAAHMPAPGVWDDRIRVAERDGMAGLAPATLERWFTPAFRKREPATLDLIAAMIAGTPVAGFVACCRAIQAMDQRHLLADIVVPTLVICGADDPSTTAETARGLHREIKGSKLVILPDAAHLANVEQPQAFNVALGAFLDANS